MKRLVSTILFLSSVLIVMGQSESAAIDATSIRHKTVVSKDHMNNTVFDATYTSARLPRAKSLEDSAIMVYKKLNKYFEYPEIDKLYGIEGRAAYQILINAEGNLVEINAIHSPSQRLTRSFKKFMSDYFSKWESAQVGNNDTSTSFILPVNFRLM